MEELKEMEEYVKSIDPFDIPLDKHRRIMNDNRYSNLANQILIKLDELHGDWIREKFKKTKAQSIVVCDRKVIYYLKNRYEPSDEEIRKMEEEMGKPCYVITDEPLIEERSSWSFLSEGDYYPTVEILGRIDGITMCLRKALRLGAISIRGILTTPFWMRGSVEGWKVKYH